MWGSLMIGLHDLENYKSVSDWYEPGAEMGICLTDAAEKCRETVGDNIQLTQYLQSNL